MEVMVRKTVTMIWFKCLVIRFEGSLYVVIFSPLAD